MYQSVVIMTGLGKKKVLVQVRPFQTNLKCAGASEAGMPRAPGCCLSDCSQTSDTETVE